MDSHNATAAPRGDLMCKFFRRLSGYLVLAVAFALALLTLIVRCNLTSLPGLLSGIGESASNYVLVFFAITVYTCLCGRWSFRQRSAPLVFIVSAVIASIIEIQPIANTQDGRDIAFGIAGAVAGSLWMKYLHAPCVKEPKKPCADA